LVEDLSLEDLSRKTAEIVNKLPEADGNRTHPHYEIWSVNQYDTGRDWVKVKERLMDKDRSVVNTFTNRMER
jgi:hypothetical protein